MVTGECAHRMGSHGRLRTEITRSSPASASAKPAAARECEARLPRSVKACPNRRESIAALSEPTRGQRYRARRSLQDLPAEGPATTRPGWLSAPAPATIRLACSRWLSRVTPERLTWQPSRATPLSERHSADFGNLGGSPRLLADRRVPAAGRRQHPIKVAVVRGDRQDARAGGGPRLRPSASASRPPSESSNSMMMVGVMECPFLVVGFVTTTAQALGSTIGPVGRQEPGHWYPGQLCCHRALPAWSVQV